MLNLPAAPPYITILELPREERPAAKAKGTVKPSILYSVLTTLFLFTELTRKTNNGISYNLG